MVNDNTLLSDMLVPDPNDYVGSYERYRLAWLLAHEMSLASYLRNVADIMAAEINCKPDDLAQLMTKAANDYEETLRPRGLKTLGDWMHTKTEQKPAPTLSVSKAIANVSQPEPEPEPAQPEPAAKPQAPATPKAIPGLSMMPAEPKPVQPSHTLAMPATSDDPDDDVEWTSHIFDKQSSSRASHMPKPKEPARIELPKPEPRNKQAFALPSQRKSHKAWRKD